MAFYGKDKAFSMEVFDLRQFSASSYSAEGGFLYSL